MSASEPTADSPERTRALLDAVYGELRRLAYREMAGEPRGMTLQPTALVHEVFLRLDREADVQWTSRAQFFGAAATAMRRILVEAARSRRGLRRGGAFRRVPLEDGREGFELGEREEPGGEDLLALDSALDGLERVDPRLFQVVQLRYFAGLSIEETADVLEVSPRTVGREWETARLWLYRKLAQGGGDEQRRAGDAS